MERLNPSNLVSYLAGRGLLAADEPIQVETLTGGFVNVVFRATTRGRSLVVKQALPDSRETRLQADISRALWEVEAMKAIRRYCGDACPIPEVIDHDPANYVVVMSAAPRDSVLYEAELMAGRRCPGVAAQLGRYAARLHASTSGDPELARAFADNPGFALRDQSVRSAGLARPDLAPRLDAILARCREHAICLVDHDITPKNVLVHRDGITKLDFECTQYADPAFDLGVALAHFLLAGYGHPPGREWVLEEALEFLQAYVLEMGRPLSLAVSARTVDYLAGMLLGRVVGDLVFPFLLPHRAAIETLARRLLVEAPLEVEQALELAARAMEADLGSGQKRQAGDLDRRGA